MPLKRYYYSASIPDFLDTDPNEILGELTRKSDFDVARTQRDAWLEEIQILQGSLRGYQGWIYFEFSIPRMGERIDVVLLIGAAIFVLEFKTGASEFTSRASDQVLDYALDLKNFHETSHKPLIAPMLVATRATYQKAEIFPTPHDDKVLFPIKSNGELLPELIDRVLALSEGADLRASQWESGGYQPTPTIIEAAIALYNGHSVREIARSDATAINLADTSDAISDIISLSKDGSQKSICFVTGVPGAGKTLIGLNIATKYIDKKNALYSVFLSGNGPLVAVLREALARDKIRREKEQGKRVKRGQARSEVKTFIQNVHHFRDECLVDDRKPPIEHVALFDEAQRAWNLQQTANFMGRKKNTPNFRQSEPEFLISCLDRHSDWAVVVCLVGGGQEINTGEAGIREWIESLNRSFPSWQIFISPRLKDSEYGTGAVLGMIESRANVVFDKKLHLSVSMRSFRAENVSLLVKHVLDLDAGSARDTFERVHEKYPLALTRDLHKAKQWLRKHARGSERYGIVVSSQAERLKPHAIDVKSPMNPIHWFLDEKDDVRSSYYLEDVGTEFDVQGLELDWVCVTWDGDFRYDRNGWQHWSFAGNRWNRITKPERKAFLKNAYRVLLTRARQGMIIVVPGGDIEDPTRKPEFYDPTYEYLRTIGLKVL